MNSEEMNKLMKGAPKKVRTKKKKFTLEIEQDVYDRIIRIARKKGFKPAEVYRMLLSIGLRSYEEMEKEIADRFGSLPDPAHNLMYQLRVKVLARQARVGTIGVNNGRLALRSYAGRSVERTGSGQHGGLLDDRFQ